MSIGARLESLEAVWLCRNARALANWSGMTGQVKEEIVDGVAQLKGASAAKVLRRRGVELLHEVIEATDVGPLREHVLERLRHPLLAMAVSIGREFLGWDWDFYVDDYLILRINFPYEKARNASRSAENPGVGRLSPGVRGLYNFRKVIDPVYDPRSYHRGQPPAAWAHGPHLDSWTGHSRGGRNIWWAIGNVPAEAGMVLYPELAHESIPCDPRTLYIKAGFALPEPTLLPLQSGEMLVFDPEILHGTRLNTTNETRVAVSMRINASKPTFEPSCFYAREFWRRAVDIEREIDEVIHLPREENLGSPTPERRVDYPLSLPRVVGCIEGDASVIRAKMDSSSLGARRIVLEAGPHRFLVVRTGSGLRAFDSECPVNGVDLADGGCDDRNTYCPGCAVGFDLETGRSSTPSLSLKSYQIEQQANELVIRITQ